METVGTAREKKWESGWDSRSHTSYESCFKNGKMSIKERING